MSDRDYISRDGEDLRFRKGEPRIHPSAELKEVRLGRFCEIGQRCLMRDVVVGDHTYFERGGEATHASLGKFCSVASNVRINALAHPMDRITTHRISYRPNEVFRFRGVDHEWREARARSRVEIGHDVWIGHGAIILPGVSIGTGAVIGAGAVVTRDVAAYTIVAGSPARALRRRFEPDIAARLMALGWWDWPPEVLFDAVPDMQALEARAFLERWEGRMLARKETGEQNP